MRATYVGVCPRCDEPIRQGERIVTTSFGDYIHAGCSSGQDDE